MLLGVVWYRFGAKALRALEDLPSDSWLVTASPHKQSSEQKNKWLVGAKEAWQVVWTMGDTFWCLDSYCDIK